MYSNIEYTVPSFVGLVVVLYTAPWHFKTGNIATLSMIFWMMVQNIVHLVNGFVWSNNTKEAAPFWGDLSCALTIGFNYGLPISHFILAKQLELFTTLRPNSPIYDASTRRIHRIFDLSLAFGGPPIGMLLYLSTMCRRMVIIERLGPMPAIYWNGWAIFCMAIIPTTIACGCGIYTVLALVNIHRRKKQLRSLVPSGGSISRDQFWRLMLLAVLEMGTCDLRAAFNFMSLRVSEMPPPHHNMTMVSQSSWESLAPFMRSYFNVEFYTVVACSYVFFICFATGTETKRFYAKLIHKIFPFLPSPEKTIKSERFGSSHKGLTSEMSTMSLGSTAGYEKSPTTPTLSRDTSSHQLPIYVTVEKDTAWSQGIPPPARINREPLGPMVVDDSDSDALSFKKDIKAKETASAL